MEAFGSDHFSRLTGLMVVVVVIISTATIARGTARYAQAFVVLPEALIAGLVVLAFTAVACLGVRDSVRAAAVMTMIELAGLMLVVSAGLAPVHDIWGQALALVPTGLAAWIRVCAGAFLAFFAFTGFKTLRTWLRRRRTSVANGVLIQILMLSRLFYGMARRSLLPNGRAAASP